MNSPIVIEKFEILYAASKFPPRIFLKTSDDKYVGQLIFNPNNSTLPANSLEDGYVNLYYHQEDFQNLVSVLRSGKQVFLIFKGTGPLDENGLKTEEETIGSIVKKAPPPPIKTPKTPPQEDVNEQPPVASTTEEQDANASQEVQKSETETKSAQGSEEKNTSNKTKKP